MSRNVWKIDQIIRSILPQVRSEKLRAVSWFFWQLFLLPGVEPGATLPSSSKVAGVVPPFIAWNAQKIHVFSGLLCICHVPARNSPKSSSQTDTTIIIGWHNWHGLKRVHVQRLEDVLISFWSTSGARRISSIIEVFILYMSLNAAKTKFSSPTEVDSELSVPESLSERSVQLTPWHRKCLFTELFTLNFSWMISWIVAPLFLLGGECHCLKKSMKSAHSPAMARSYLTVKPGRQTRCRHYRICTGKTGYNSSCQKAGKVLNVVGQE